MNDLNNVSLVGRLTRDVDVKYTAGGMAVGNMAIAVNRSVKKDGQWTDAVNFFDITLFGKTCENLQSYLTKGKQVCLSGHLNQDRWEKDGQKYSKVTIVADTIQLLGGKSETESSGTTGRNKIAPNRPVKNNNDFPEDVPYEESNGNGEEIPF